MDNVVEFSHGICIHQENENLSNLFTDLAHDTYYLCCDGWHPNIDGGSNFTITERDGIFQGYVKFYRRDEVKIHSKLRAKKITRVG